jgi:uncharacterized membrane protein
MNKIESLKEQKLDLREVFKSFLYLILGLLTGITTIIFKILSGDLPVYMLFFSFIGILVMFLIIVYTYILWNKMMQINKEIENV